MFDKKGLHPLWSRTARHTMSGMKDCRWSHPGSDHQFLQFGEDHAEGRGTQSHGEDWLLNCAVSCFPSPEDVDAALRHTRDEDSMCNGPCQIFPSVTRRSWTGICFWRWDYSCRVIQDNDRKESILPVVSSVDTCFSVPFAPACVSCHRIRHPYQSDQSELLSSPVSLWSSLLGNTMLFSKSEAHACTRHELKKI